MANDIETVEQVCEVLNQYPKAEASDGSGLVVLNNTVIAKRILAAHKREIEKITEENAELQRMYLDAKYRVGEKIREIAKRDALIKEMTVALSGSLDIVGNVSEFLSLDYGTMLREETYREILAKAREVVK